jgi:hypothetical protein
MIVFRRHSGRYEDATATESLRRGDITPSIADVPDTPGVERKILHCLLEEQGARLSALAGTLNFRVVGAVVASVDSRAGLFQELLIVPSYGFVVLDCR